MFYHMAVPTLLATALLVTPTVVTGRRLAQLPAAEDFDFDITDMDSVRATFMSTSEPLGGAAITGVSEAAGGGSGEDTDVEATVDSDGIGTTVTVSSCLLYTSPSPRD